MSWSSARRQRREELDVVGGIAEHVEGARDGRRVDVDEALERLHHHPHGRPRALGVLRAPARHLARPLHLGHVGAAAEAGVHGALEVAGEQEARRRRREEIHRAVLPLPHVPPSGDDLEQHHPVAEHVGLGRDRRAGDPLRRQVADRPAHCRQHAAEVAAHQLGEPEVGDLGGERVVEEDVLRLDVAVDDAVPAFLVQVVEPPRDAQCDLIPRLPAQDAAMARAGAEEVPVQRAVRHVLVHEQPPRPLGAEAEQPDQVDVLDGADGAHLRAELLLPLSNTLQLLHRHRRPVRRQRALEHRPEGAAAELLGEVLGHELQVTVRERHQGALHSPQRLRPSSSPNEDRDHDGERHRGNYSGDDDPDDQFLGAPAAGELGRGQADRNSVAAVTGAGHVAEADEVAVPERAATVVGVRGAGAVGEARELAVMSARGGRPGGAHAAGRQVHVGHREEPVALRLPLRRLGA
uniref:Uncharacterized protein n=1 Tax=Oryza brachyantha TaxID=4533 RepID=J3L6M1_ORYBR